MKLIRLTMILVCVCFATAVMADELSDLLAKHYEASGGLERIKAVKTIRMTGKMNMQGMEAPFTVWAMRPGKVRIEFSLQGMTGIQATDGQTAWQIMPFMGKTEAEPMSEDEAKELNEQADIDGVLVDWKEKGHQVELAGMEDVEGTSCYKIKVITKNGDERYIYIDAEYFLQIRSEGKRKMQGTEVETFTSFGDFKDEGGLMMPHVMESGIKGTEFKQTLTFETVELNPAVDPSMFTMPAKPAAAPQQN